MYVIFQEDEEVSEDYANKLMGKAQTGPLGKQELNDLLNDHAVSMQALRSKQQREKQQQQQKRLHKRQQMLPNTGVKTMSSDSRQIENIRQSSSKTLGQTVSPDLGDIKSQGTHVVTVSSARSSVVAPTTSSPQHSSGSRNNHQSNDGDSEDSEIEVCYARGDQSCVSRCW